MERELPVLYKSLEWYEKAEVREQYIKEQEGVCLYCGCDIYSEPPKWVLDKQIKLELFPPGFFDHPIHLQHNHKTGMTEGSVHSYCNAVLWQYEGK